MTICQVLSTTFLAFHIYSRVRLLRVFKLEDFLVILGWVCTTCNGDPSCSLADLVRQLFATTASVLGILQIPRGLGKHILAVSPEHTPKLLLYSFIAQLEFITALWVTKLSICVTFARLFDVRVVTKSIIIGIATIFSLSSVAQILVAIFQCKPVSAHWKPQLIASACIDIEASFWTGSVINLVVDIGLIAITITQILPMRLPRAQKIALFIVLSLSWLAVVACVIRIVVTAGIYAGAMDITWDSAKVAIWAAVELHVSVFCVSVPYVKPLFVKLAPWLFSTSTAREDSSEASYVEGKLPDIVV